MIEELTREQTLEKIDDWIVRLNKLYNRVEKWTPSNYKIHRSEISQRIEKPLQHYHILPKKLPTLALFLNKERIVFVPSSLWILGADGRINLTTNRKQYTLVDLRTSQEEPSNWQIVVDDVRKGTEPFDFEYFLQILSNAS